MDPLCSDPWQPWIHEHLAGWLLFARQQTRSEADAQDVVQEALAETWQRLIGKPLPGAGLMFATIRRRAIDFARQHDRRTAREQTVHAAAPTLHFDTTAEHAELGWMVQQALQKLPAIHREVVTLKVWGELTFAEIGETLDLPPNTVASRYRYGLEALRKLTKPITRQ